MQKPAYFCTIEPERRLNCHGGPMREIINQMAQFEESIHQFYRDLQSHYRSDGYIHSFLQQLADDEKEHVRIIGKVSQHLNHQDPMERDVAWSPSDLKRLMTPLEQARAKLSKGPLSREELFECIVSVEFSEWNDLFSYVVSTIVQRDKTSLREFEKMQRHRLRIEQFFQSIPDGEPYLEQIRRAPRAWGQRILIAEDNPAVAQLLKLILERVATVEIAENGEEALQKTAADYYRIIISDVDMPVMDGIEFYERAVAQYPDIRSRFLFFTGDASAQRIAFFTENNIPYFIKPARFQTIRNKVMEMMNISPDTPAHP